LPSDRPRPPLPSHRGARRVFEFSRELTKALNELRRREGVTLYMVLLAAFQLLLSRWSGQKDVVVGSPIAGRRHQATESMIGFFVNTLVMRTNLSGNPTFRELLGRVQKVTLGAYTHQDLPFEKLVEELALRRDLSRQAMFQVMFTLQNQPVTGLEWPGVKLAPLEVEPSTSKFDLAVDFVEISGQLRGKIDYATDLFDEGTIEPLVASFQTLLEGIVADVQQPISDYDCVPLAG
jgi:non-ribosomal peptide synthetase component F